MKNKNVTLKFNQTLNAHYADTCPVYHALYDTGLFCDIKVYDFKIDLYVVESGLNFTLDNCPKLFRAIKKYDTKSRDNFPLKRYRLTYPVRI